MVMSPGPNGALLLKTVPLDGKKHGYANVLGIVSSFYLHGTFSIYGLSAIIVASANLFLTIKVVGALYLAYLGVKALLSAFNGKPNQSSAVHVSGNKIQKPISNSFIEGLLTNLLNPKVSIFYLAAFPQFVDFQSNAIISSYTLVTVHALFAALWFSLIVNFLGRSAAMINSSKMHSLVQSATGVVLLWFSYRIATVK